MTRGRILITGGQGYLGCVVVGRLLQQGYSVVSVDDGSCSTVTVDLPGVTYVSSDVVTPADWVGALRGVQAVVHLAAVVGDPACAADEDRAWRTNYLGTIRVAEACRRAGVERLVFASTCSNYGLTGDGEVDVYSPLLPQSAYARFKVLAEHHLLSLGSAWPEPCVMRFATLHGRSPRMRFDLAVNVMTAHAVAEGRVTVHGGTQWRPFLHVEDAAMAIQHGIETTHRRRPAIYNVGSDDQNFQIRAIAEIIAREVAGTVVDVVPGADDPRSYRVRFAECGEALSFQRRLSVVDGVREIRDAMLAGAYLDHAEAKYSNALIPRATAL